MMKDGHCRAVMPRIGWCKKV